MSVAQVWHDPVPTRPSQTTDDQRARWARTRLDVGTRIRKIRIARGLTQEAVALEAAMSRNLLIEIEHGRVGALYERLVDLAEVLGVPTGSFFDDDQPVD